MLVLDPEPLLEAFYLSRGVDDALLTGEKGVAPAADFDLQCGLSCADGEGVAAGTNNLSLIIVLGMYLLFHSTTSTPACAGAGPVLNRIDADLPLILVRPTEFDQPIGKGKDSVIPAQANVVSRVNPCAPLPHQDAPCSHQLAVKPLDPESFGLAIPAQPAAATCFLVCHFLEF